MKRRLDLLACPQCRSALSLEVFENGEHVDCIEGVLTCKPCSSWYPVANGIPRLFLDGPLRPDDTQFLARWGDKIPNKTAIPNSKGPQNAQAMVQETFGYKWTRQAWWGMDGESAKVMEEWLLPRYGWPNRKAYEDYLESRTTMLDAGCGLGRESLRLAMANPQARVLGLELSRCVDEAARHAREQSVDNVFYIQADLTAPPLKDSAFDFIISEGVLHHTPDTKNAFLAVVPLLAQEGEFGFYVYRKKAPLREFADDYIRGLIQDLPPEKAWQLMEPLTRFGKLLSELKIDLELLEDIEVLGIKAGKQDIQRLIYYNILKCYWNDRLTFDENVLVNFDWYHPRYAWRHTREEVEGWCKQAGLHISWFNEEEAGLTVRAKRPPK